MNTSNIDEIVKDYLNAEKTDYAIMISGDWGSGKTFYLTHEFKTLVETINIPVINDKKKKRRNKDKCSKAHYSPAVISLYGVSSVEDFEVRVFCGVNSWSNNSLFRVAGLLGSKVGDYFGISSKKNDIKTVTFISKNRVLVFDDLERICEDKISVKEILGLINTFAEHSNYKVIIVCNEDVYLSDVAEEGIKESYTKYKEKSVRYTYKFIPNIGVVYDAMVSEVDDMEYKGYLVKEKDSILYLFDLGGDRNLRTLRFFIDTFGKVYNIVKTTKYHNEITRSYLVTFMLYVCEHKRGHQKKELESLDERGYRLGLNGGILGVGQNDENQAKEEKDFFSTFQEKYNTVYAEFKPSISFIDYILTGYLDIDELKREICDFNSELDRLTITSEGKVYQKLLRMTELDDDESTPLIEEMMSYLQDNKYNLYEILHIYALLLKYDFWKIEGFELTDNYDKIFMEAMHRQEMKHQYDNLFEVKTPIFDKDGQNMQQYNKYKAMKDTAMAINWQAKKRLNEEAGQLFIRDAKSGDVEKLRSYRIDEKNRVPISGIDLKQVAELIRDASNPIACEICECIISFIPGMGYLQPNEVDRVREDLLPVLDDYLTSGINKIRKIYITELRSYLNEVIR